MFAKLIIWSAVPLVVVMVMPKNHYQKLVLIRTLKTIKKVMFMGS